jgi:tetratricopeptide (TPR) repeat protein
MTDYSEFLKLSPEEFDQNEEKGWRKLEKAGKPLEAVEVIKKYLKINSDKLHTGSVEDRDLEKFMHFHIGQLLALDGQNNYQEAIEYFKKASVPEKEGWNYYVDGTVAFLTKDSNRLNKNIRGLESLEKAFGVGINNLNILLNFAEALKNSEFSYKKVYETS